MDHPDDRTLEGGAASMSVHIAAALAIAVQMLLTWIIATAIKDVSIVDIGWGLGFAVVALVSLLVTDDPDGGAWLLFVIVVAWGLRLAAYLANRNLGHGEDKRYVRMRRKHGDRFVVVSLVTVFGLQGVLMWVVSLPVQAGIGSVGDTDVPLLLGLGLLVWFVGLSFESVGDVQLSRFLADSANDGKVMDRGLWRYTRHPNYFGDACVWWGVYLVALGVSTAGWWTVIGPIVMTYLLVEVSGAKLLEKGMSRSPREGYEAYVARTSGFVPRRPRRP